MPTGPTLINDPQGLRALIATPGVVAFMTGRFVAALGIWIERIGIGWLVWTLTGSVGWVGAIAFLRLAPAIVLAPYGGVLADRVGALRLLAPCHLGNALVLVVLAVAAPMLSVGGLAGAVLALGLFQSLAAAPTKSAVAEIVPPAILPTAVPLSAMGFHLAAFVGPALAGVVIGAISLSAAFAVAAAGHLVFVLLLRRCRVHELSGAESDGLPPRLWAAAVHCLRDNTLAVVLALHLAAALLLRPVLDLLPAIAGGVADGDAVALGMITSAAGLGALLGAAGAVLWPPAGALVARMIAATCLAAGCLAGLALAGGSLIGTVCVIAVLGAALVVRATASLTLVQLAAPAAMRGRIAGLYSMVLRGGSALGALVVGALGDVIGLPLALGLAGALVLTGMAACARPLSRASGAYRSRSPAE